jgi:hypothetical protein
MDSVKRGSRRDRSAVDNEQPPLLELRGGILMRATSYTHGLAAVGRAFKGEMVTTPRFWLPVAILLALAGCQDAAAPLNEQPLAGDVTRSPADYADQRILGQSPTAPPLETYTVSFWAHSDRESMVSVNYQRAAGEWWGRPFLRFDVPRGALRAGPGGLRLGGRDSVLITLTIDPQAFTVEFQPSGLTFSRKHPASLAIWYGNANPDANGDGIVDSADQAFAAQIAIWGRPVKAAPWMKTSSQTDTGQQWVSAALFHFSEYAVGW